MLGNHPAVPLSLLDDRHGYSVGRFALDQMPFDLVARDPHGRRINPPLFDCRGKLPCLTSSPTVIRFSPCVVRPAKAPPASGAVAQADTAPAICTPSGAEADRQFIEQHGWEASMFRDGDGWFIDPRGRAGIRPQPDKLGPDLMGTWPRRWHCAAVGDT